MPPSKNEIGNRYGHLVVVARLENENRKDENGKIIKSSSKWLCKCDCGNEVPVLANNFRRKNSTSCGKCMPPEDGAFNAFYKRTANSAKYRGYIWELSKDDVRYLTSQPCYYCGNPPSQVSRGRTYRGEYVYNGIDRIQNNIGYIKSNVVPCCKNCNFAKHTMTQEDFLKLVSRIYKRRVLCVIDSDNQ